MKLQTAVLTALMFMAAAFATAAEPVAVRVDVEPVSFGDDGTRVAVTVQVAPEDRGRIGRNAMVRSEPKEEMRAMVETTGPLLPE